MYEPVWGQVRIYFHWCTGKKTFEWMFTLPRFPAMKAHNAEIPAMNVHFAQISSNECTHCRDLQLQWLTLPTFPARKLTFQDFQQKNSHIAISAIFVQLRIFVYNIQRDDHRHYAGGNPVLSLLRSTREVLVIQTMVGNERMTNCGEHAKNTQV